MNEELYHHGIKGQKWGQRNGPPYPLNPSDHSASEKKAGQKKNLIGSGNETGKDKAKSILDKLRKKKPVEQAKPKEEKPLTEEEKKERIKLFTEEVNRRKAQAISEGNATDVLKLKKHMTTNELTDAVNRMEKIKKIKEFKAAENPSVRKKVQTRVNNITKAINDGMDLYNAIERVHKAFKTDDETITKGQKMAKDILKRYDKMSDKEIDEAKDRLKDVVYIENVAKGNSKKGDK